HHRSQSTAQTDPDSNWFQAPQLPPGRTPGISLPDYSPVGRSDISDNWTVSYKGSDNSAAESNISPLDRRQERVTIRRIPPALQPGVRWQPAQDGARADGIKAVSPAKRGRAEREP